MEELLHFLESIQPLSPALREHLSNILQFRVVPRKGFLVKAGHVCRNIYFIREGLVRCYYLRGEEEVCSWFMKERDVMIAIESFYSQLPSYENLQAMEETEVYYITYDQLQHIYREYPEFNVTGRVLTQEYHRHWAWQLYAIRMHSGRQRYQWLQENHGELVLRVPGRYLATYLGLADITLRKIKSSRR